MGGPNKESLIGMPCISIQQPWPYAIFYLGKPIENRSWPTTFRGTILVHAGKTLDKDGLGFLIESGHKFEFPLPTGGIVGSVEITDCVTKSTSEWFYGPYGFVLQNPQPFDLIPYKGQLGIFKITKEGLGL